MSIQSPVYHCMHITDKAADTDRMLWEGGWVGGDLGDIVRHH